MRHGPERNPAWRPAMIYTCRMHPEIAQDHPGMPEVRMTLNRRWPPARKKKRRRAMT
jgi:hypothetical protein